MDSHFHGIPIVSFPFVLPRCFRSKSGSETWPHGNLETWTPRYRGRQITNIYRSCSTHFEQPTRRRPSLLGMSVPHNEVLAFCAGWWFHGSTHPEDRVSIPGWDVKVLHTWLNYMAILPSHPEFCQGLYIHTLHNMFDHACVANIKSQASDPPQSCLKPDHIFAFVGGYIISQKNKPNHDPDVWQLQAYRWAYPINYPPSNQTWLVGKSPITMVSKGKIIELFLVAVPASHVWSHQRV